MFSWLGPICFAGHQIQLEGGKIEHGLLKESGGMCSSPGARLANAGRGSDKHSHGEPGRLYDDLRIQQAEQGNLPCSCSSKAQNGQNKDILC